MKIENLKVAIFFDWLNQWGGAERLLCDILSIFPRAHLYTSVWDKSKTSWLPPQIKVFTSKLNLFPFLRHNSPLSVALQPFFLEHFNFKNYRLVISLTSQNGHCLLTPPETTFVCYHLNPNRYLYQLSQPKILQPIFTFYKKIDWIYGQRPDCYLTTSPTVQNRIYKTYGRKAKIVHPGVNTDFFRPTPKLHPGRYFLTVSRLVKHKRIDLAIKACHRLQQPLIVTGTGRDRKRLQNIFPNSPLIKFTGQVSERKILRLYQNCRALICPQEEDFGLTPLEAMACGKPVIAYNTGGIAGTVIHRQTGILFSQQTVNSLIKAIRLLPTVQTNRQACRHQSLKFNRHHFMLNFTHSIKALAHDQPKI